MINVYVLIDDSDNPENNALISEHGLSVIVETKTQTILFDTGRSESFMLNAKALSKSVDRIDNVIISHAHYDHANGLPFLIDRIEKIPRVYVGINFFYPKFKLVNNSYKNVGISKELIGLKQKGLDFKEISEPIFEIGENAFVVRRNTLESNIIDENYGFCIKKDCGYTQDYFEDEISLVIKQDDGIVLFVGCPHNGIENIVKSANEMFKMPVKYVFGGFHLKNSNNEEISAITEQFKKAGVKKIFTGHCTESSAVSLLSKSSIECDRIYSGYCCTLK